ncbi:MAG: ribosomal L7Ae/L30e/S12e/Gadd45 family protein [Nitrososphaerales archaeon]
MSKILEQIIKDSFASNKCRVGTRDVLRSIKNSKLIICSQSLSDDVKSKLEQAVKSSNVPIYRFDSTSLELGRLCNKPFRISVISIDSSSSSDITAILEEINKQETANS